MININMRDISNKKNGTRTQILINIRHSPYISEKSFLDVMALFTDNGSYFNCENYFYKMVRSSRNHKYYTNMDVGKTEDLYNRFSKALHYYIDGKITKEEIFNKYVFPYLPEDVKNRYRKE